MTTLVEERINRAIHDCLARCYQTDDIVHQMAKFLDELKKTGSWATDEIHSVELTVLNLLHLVVERPDPPVKKNTDQQARHSGPNRPR